MRSNKRRHRMLNQTLTRQELLQMGPRATSLPPVIQSQLLKHFLRNRHHLFVLQ